MTLSSLFCLALAIHFEARGEPPAGQLAVAQVVLTRAGFDRRKVCQVIKRRKQFSFLNGTTLPRLYRKARRQRDAWLRSIRMAKKALSLRRKDFPVPFRTTHYHATTVTPSWTFACRKHVRIGGHVFAGDCVSQQQLAQLQID